MSNEILIGKSDDWKNGEKLREKKKPYEAGMVRTEEKKWSPVISTCQE